MKIQEVQPVGVPKNNSGAEAKSTCKAVGDGYVLADGRSLS
jgi:hypothetical protein